MNHIRGVITIPGVEILHEIR